MAQFSSRNKTASNLLRLMNELTTSILEEARKLQENRMFYVPSNKLFELDRHINYFDNEAILAALYPVQVTNLNHIVMFYTFFMNLQGSRLQSSNSDLRFPITRDLAEPSREAVPSTVNESTLEDPMKKSPIIMRLDSPSKKRWKSKFKRIKILRPMRYNQEKVKEFMVDAVPQIQSLPGAVLSTRDEPTLEDPTEMPPVLHPCESPPEKPFGSAKRKREELIENEEENKVSIVNELFADKEIALKPVVRYADQVNTKLQADSNNDVPSSSLISTEKNDSPSRKQNTAKAKALIIDPDEIRKTLVNPSPEDANLTLKEYIMKRMGKPIKVRKSGLFKDLRKASDTSILKAESGIHARNKGSISNKVEEPSEAVKSEERGEFSISLSNRPINVWHTEETPIKDETGNVEESQRIKEEVEDGVSEKKDATGEEEMPEKKVKEEEEDELFPFRIQI